MSDSKPPNIDHFSASSMGQYERCPFSYYLSYIKCVPRKRSFINDNALIFGKVYHKGLEFHYTDGKTFDDGIREGLKETQEEYKKDVSKRYFSIFSDKLKLRASQMFHQYQKTIVVDFEPTEVEKQINARLVDPVTKMSISTGFMGIIDMVLGDDVLCDHKTTGNFYRSLKPHHIRQANIYAMMYKMDTGNTADSFFLSVHNRNSFRWKRYNIDISEEQQHKTFLELEKMSENIFAGEFRPTPGDACVYCPYWESYYEAVCKLKKNHREVLAEEGEKG